MAAPLYYCVITIKLKLTETIDVKKYQKQFTSIRNYAFNRFNEGYKQNQIEQQVKTKLNNIDLMDVSFQKEAVNEARIYIKEDQKTVVFGGKKNREKYHKGQITKEEYQKKRLSSIIVRGETGVTEIFSIQDRFLLGQNMDTLSSFTSFYMF